MSKGSDFQQTVLSESEVATPRSNPSNNTIPPAQIAQNANFSDIFPFEFEANESPFLLSNAAVNEQKAITAIYTEAEVEGKPIQLILDSESARSIITYQLIQQLQRTVDRPAQTVIVIADNMKKTPKQPPYILLKCKDYKKKLSSMRACISPKEEYKTHICYFCKACHRKRFEYLKKSGKWNNTSCFTCGDMLPEEYNWIDITMRGEVCDQTCQYALSISEKVKRGTLFNAVYNSALNKLDYYPYDTEIIFDLAMALINRAIQEDVQQIKEAEYIEYTMELARFNYEDEVETYHQIISHTYPTQEAQIQQLEQMNIQLYKECIMLCNDKWCSECYALSILLPSKNDQEKIEFGKPKTKEEIATISIYLTKNQPAIQLKYFDNNEQEIKPEKAHKIDAEYDFRYLGKNTLRLESYIAIFFKMKTLKLSLITENYHLLEKKLSQINMDLLELQQQRQLKQLIAKFADIFAKNNDDLGKTDIV
ncbi:hypothetical protein G9A89_003602 [Geosiphon pyriformis]|nr:hypothetical protein G9A89_003602 [Geosiphon pyriformis]